MLVLDGRGTGGALTVGALGSAARTGSTLERFQDDDGLVGYRSPALARLGVPHLFTTRIGAGRELDLGDMDAAAAERLARAAGLPGAGIVTIQQVHGARALAVGPGPLPSPTSAADALVSTRSDVLVSVHVADCVPILVAALDGRRVAAIHAGWRGLAAGVIPRALAAFAGAPALAAIGPCLSLGRFEVGPEVVEAFRRAGLGAAIDERPGARAHIDLRLAARAQLEANGARQVEVSAACTYDQPEECYSFRRDVTHGGRAGTGRLGALIAAKTL